MTDRVWWDRDLWPQAMTRSRDGLTDRVRRLRDRAAFLAQIGVAAAVAWWLAHDLLGHRLPFFAPVAAAICLGLSYGQRLRRTYEVVAGVAVGVLFGDVFTHLFGTGVWQIAVVSVLAMAAATLLGAGVLMTTQAGVQSIIVVTLVPNTGAVFSRWADAVVGGAVALVVTLLAPVAPVRDPRAFAARAVAEIGGILRDTTAVLRLPDPAERPTGAAAVMGRARQSQDLVAALREASAEGMAVVRMSLLRRTHRLGVQQINQILGPVDRALGNLRVLVRRCTVAARRDDQIPGTYLALLDDLAGVTDDMARALHEGELPVAVRARLVQVGTAAGPAANPTSLDAEVVRGQLRSIVTDLLILTGLTYEEAFELIPPPTPGPATD